MTGVFCVGPNGLPSTWRISMIAYGSDEDPPRRVVSAPKRPLAWVTVTVRTFGAASMAVRD